MKTDTLQKGLDEVGAQGYRLLPRTVTSKGGCCGGEIVVVVELAPGEARRYEYRLVATSTLRTEVTEWAEAGFVIAALVGRGQLIMERQAQ